MKTTWSYSDEVFARGVHIVPDFEPEPVPPPQYVALVLLGPEPLTLKEVGVGVLLVGVFIASSACVVAVLWWLAKVIL